jgi:hypothetical protein
MLSKRPRAGVSRIAVLVVVSACIIGLGVAVYAIQRARKQQARTATLNNLSQISKAIHLCHDQFRKLPPYYGLYGAKTGRQTFHHHLLQFVDWAPHLSAVPDVGMVEPFLSSLDPSQDNSNGMGAANFVFNIRMHYTDGGLGQLSSQDSLVYPKIPESFPDGASTTLLLATKYRRCGANGGSLWNDPEKNALDSPTAATFGVSMGLWQQAPDPAACVPLAGTAVSFQKDIIQVALCDASVRTVAVGISEKTWQALHTPGGGDKVGPDWVE